jgi:GNAT superfamily N-acetyltransferase
MRFELSDALIDDILFTMESQYGDFLVDTKQGMVINTENPEELDEEIDFYNDKSGRFIDLPEWDSADGFSLMEHFTAGVKNKAVQEALNRALKRGRGVFRSFKDALETYPEYEKRWFAWKEEEMRKAIRTWYEGLCEEWGVDGVTPPSDKRETNDTDELVAEDFTFRDAGAADLEKALTLHNQCMEEHTESAGELAMGDLLFDRFSLDGEDPGAVKIAALSVGGDFAGYIAASPAGRAMHIRELLVAPEYRGLGLGEALLNKLLERLRERGKTPLSIDIPNNFVGFSSALVKAGFTAMTTRWVEIV